MMIHQCTYIWFTGIKLYIVYENWMKSNNPIEKNFFFSISIGPLKFSQTYQTLFYIKLLVRSR
jgi:hypothetical protein